VTRRGFDHRQRPPTLPPAAPHHPRIGKDVITAIPPNPTRIITRLGRADWVPEERGGKALAYKPIQLFPVAYGQEHSEGEGGLLMR